jgi:hypothetical protein
MTNKERLFVNDKELANKLITAIDVYEEFIGFKAPDGTDFLDKDYDNNERKSYQAAVQHTIKWLNT